MKELEDYEWFPKPLRQMQLEFIGYVVYKSALLKPVIPIIEALITTNKFIHIVDLCSGSGMPMLYFSKHLTHRLPITLTDKYPQPNTTNATLRYQYKPVDVLTIQYSTNTIYTMFNAFHHFTGIEQKHLLQKAAAQKATIIIAEILTPTIWTMLQVFFSTTIVQILLSPFVLPFRWQRLFFTYLIPINIITVLWDGILSVLKSKTKEAYAATLLPLHNTNYSITIRTVKSKGNTITLIIGKPDA